VFRRLILYVLLCTQVITLGLSSYANVGASLVLTPCGRVLHEKNSHKKLFPASLTKLMTVYLVLEGIKQKKLSFNTQFVTSRNASYMPASRLGLREGDKISARDAILSLLVKSCNDVAVVLAEGFAGSEAKFVKIMNEKSRVLGMHDTHFRNASGWHHPNQITTARDMAKLAIALMRDFPEYYHMFSVNSFLFKRSIYKNSNHVRKHLKGVEGMKTGYTSHAGWNIVTTARRGATRLIGVVLGGSSNVTRDLTMMKLMDKYFSLTSFRASNQARDKKVKYG
jgi:D-alanyl-D-alanine carboxypeptidase (penicillin-binding protein 5/6)